MKKEASEERIVGQCSEKYVLSVLSSTPYIMLLGIENIRKQKFLSMYS